MSKYRLSRAATYKYLKSLVNRFFKILPLKEEGEDTLQEYMESLLMELLGFRKLSQAVENDNDFVTLVSILQYLVDNPDVEIRRVKREVFRAISICNKLSAIYGAPPTIRVTEDAEAADVAQEEASV